MCLFADDNCNLWSTEKSVLFNIPARFGEESVARGGKAGEVGHRRACDDCTAAPFGQAEEFTDPFNGNFLEFGACWGGDPESGVLVPRSYQPTRGLGRRQ